MSLERGYDNHDKIVVDKYADPSEDYQMTTRDYVVRVDASSAAVTVTLPSVSETRGRIYSISAADATNNITITDKGDSEAWSDITLTMSNNRALLYSDGMFWYTLASVIG